jgi:hypothetical protein
MSLVYGLPPAASFLYTRWQCIKNLNIKFTHKVYGRIKKFQELSCVEITMLPVHASGMEFAV